MFKTTETIIDLVYGPGYQAWDKNQAIKDSGITHQAYTDIDIESIENLWDINKPIRFHKVRDYPTQSKLYFYIYDATCNKIITVLVAILNEQRIYFEKPRTAKVAPNMKIRLKVIQDPNKLSYKFTGKYYGKDSTKNNNSAIPRCKR